MAPERRHGAGTVRGANLLSDLVARVADVGWGMIATTPDRDMTALCEAVLSGKGEATGLAQSRAIFERYDAMAPAERRAFFGTLRDRFGVDPGRIETAWANREKSDLRQIHSASEPRSQELIRRLNRAPGGTPRLVAMREDLLAFLEGDPSLRALDDDFRHLFSSWFNRGFLELRIIDWSTPAAILEKIIRYEAVHEISGWDDLRRRVGASDRRLYAFFHPALGDDPLIFVEVALMAEMPSRIGAILADGRKTIDPAKATVAVFYSISNCQAGLRGISFGNFLIKQVVEELARDFPALETFVTLSPVPGLRAWAADATLPPRLAAIAKTGEGEGLADLTAHYMLTAKAARGGAADPVARFHLGNGARLERINAGADAGARGQAESWGVMVNYLYDPETIERNHEAYSSDGEVIAAANVRRRLKSR